MALRYNISATVLVLVGIVLYTPETVRAQNNDDPRTVRSITFKGNEAFSDETLLSLMETKPSRLFRTSHFDSELIENDVTTLTAFYQNEGYPDITVSVKDTSHTERPREVLIHITIDEGERTFIESINLLGNEQLSDSLLAAVITIAPGDPFRSRDVEDATIALMTSYANRGYLDAVVEPDINVNTERHRALIDFIITEHRQYTIDNIRILGRERTQPEIITREFSFAEGETVNYSRLLSSQHKIYLTGLFQSVFIRPEPDDSGNPLKKDIIVEVRENKSGEFSIAGGYGSIERARGKLEVYNNNLGGTARKAGLLGKVSDITRLIQASYTAPRTLGTLWQTDVNARIEYLSEPAYDVLQRGGTLTIGRRFRERTTVTATYRHEDGSLKRITTSEIPEDATTTTRSLKLTIVYDSRNNLFNPTGGRYVALSNEWGGYSLKSEDRFNRTELQVKFFFPYKKTTIFATGIDLGLIDTPPGIDNIPLQERYYTGGPNSVRGFRYKRVGPLDDNGKPIGGRFKLVWNICEVRRQLFSRFSAVAFLDAGGVWRNTETYNSADIRIGTGLGLRMNTPVGLVRIDYGFNPDRRSGESSGEWYMSLGQAF